MRFLFLAPRFHSNQADLVRKLQEEGHDVAFVVVSTNKSEDHRRVSPRVLSKTAVGERLNAWLNPSRDPAATAVFAVPSVAELWAHLREIDPDVVIVRGFLGPYLLLALPWLLLSRCRIVLYSQGAKHRAAPSKLRRLAMFTALSVLRLRWFTTVDRYALDDARVSDLHPRLVFIPFFKYAEPGAEQRTYRERPRFLAVAKYNRRKNLSALVEAFAMAPAHDDVTLTIIGENSRAEHREVLARLRDQVRSLGLEQRVVLLENIAYEEVQRLYLDYDVFVMPSYAEPASISQIEAMAHGLAVVCNRDNGTAHYINDGVSGSLVDGDAPSLSAAISKYVADPTLAARQGRAGLARIQGAYSIDSSYRLLLRLIEEPRWLRLGYRRGSIESPARWWRERIARHKQTQERLTRGK